MRKSFVAAMPSLTGCAAGAGAGPMTAVYSPPVRLGGTGQMLVLPASGPLALPIEAPPHPAALADAAACRARLAAIAARAARRYSPASGVAMMPGEDDLTVLASWTPPIRVLRFRCEGERMVREDGRAIADGVVPPPPLPPIKTAPVLR